MQQQQQFALDKLFKQKRTRRTKAEIEAAKKEKEAAKKEKEAVKKAKEAQKAQKQAYRWDLGTMYAQAPKKTEIGRAHV